MGVLRAEEAHRLAAEHCRALVTVAGHSTNARECTELLDMLGLDAGLWRER
ncbi:hypothetical protein H4696_005482 [Amycolatopsis lexingtonensis]|uniref:Uncharacterized protein n=1 Tax=Amycolatopsis lexingtonensis TaxID=218822 RepID=A0ABR9I602_9PSEU|nr:hypothetical protein [Amycolatopsis lexingtonensis]